MIMATDFQTTPAFSAFEKQLKTLCLREFPCGAGTWRESKPKKVKKLNNISTHKVDSRFSITLKDYGAQHEKTETLEEYVGSTTSPWNLDYSWSEEARQLREIAVKSPWLIDDNFVLSYFKTLRIVNKNVTEIDPNLLEFQNLEELTLSCNFISEINSRNLPPKLKVLEVCANQISDLESLCVKPPDLIHLGLGHNKITFIGDYLTGSYWPSLLSLDMSNNNLNDLLDVVNKVGSLPKLRNLVLQGNPLSLIPGYRGYTVDSLRKLSVLDDIMISADERHYFKGLARRREHILDEAKIKLSVSYIKGIPMPDELKNPEDQPEFPVLERRYFVQFMFLEDTTMKTEGLQMYHEDELDEMGDMSVFPTDRTEKYGSDIMDVNGVDQSIVEKNVLFTQEPDILHTIDNIVELPAEEPVTSPEVMEKKKDETQEPRVIKIEAVKSEGHAWGEEIECAWSTMLVRDDLLSLRDFFKQGMEISVVEEMTLAYPVIPEEPEDGTGPPPKVLGYPVDEVTSPTLNKPTGGKDNKKDKKEKDEKAKSGGKEKGGGGDKKKKKGEPEHELKRNPPTFTTLATWHVPLAEFLEGEYEFQSVYSQGGVEVASTVRSLDSARKGSRSRGSSRNSRRSDSIVGAMNTYSMASVNSLIGSRVGSRRASQSSRSGLKDNPASKNKKVKDGKKGDPKDKNKKPPSATKRKDEKDKSKDRRMSATKPMKDVKGDKGKPGKGAPVAADEEEETGPPPPLEMHMSVRLHHWKTAMDLLRDEEEKNKAEEIKVETV